MSTTEIRRARADDVAAIVALLADDPLGAKREANVRPLPASYVRAFEAIDGDERHELVVVEERDGDQARIVGTLQLILLPHLTYQGGWRALIEAVRVAASHRGSGLGAELFGWAIERARERGCHLVQLTTDKQRPDALRFYERLGFRATHEGLKLPLEPGAATSRAEQDGESAQG